MVLLVEKDYGVGILCMIVHMTSLWSIGFPTNINPQLVNTYLLALYDHSHCVATKEEFDAQ